MSKKRVIVLDKAYENALDHAIDVIFEYAADVSDLTWEELATKARLSVSTVYRLGTRVTRYPRWGTFWKLAGACKLDVRFVTPQGRVLQGMKLKHHRKPRAA